MEAYYFILFVIWFILMTIVTKMGSKRKIGGGSAFFISLWTSPIIGLIIVAFSDLKEEKKIIVKQEVVENTNQIGIADELVKLIRLKDDGVLTDDEFARQKEKILNQVQKKVIDKEYSTITIRHIVNKRVETVGPEIWEKMKEMYGEKNYEILRYNE